jgi:hypothetical protein
MGQRVNVRVVRREEEATAEFIGSQKFIASFEAGRCRFFDFVWPKIAKLRSG